MTMNLKKWVGLGLGTVALGAGVASCGSENGEQSEGVQPADDPALSASMGEMGEGEGGEGESGEMGHTMERLPLPKRLAFMTGHVEAGLALYRAGAPDMAAPHLLHPVSETHAAERAGLDALGFEASIFEKVSKALEEGRDAADIEPQLQAAEANLAMLAEKAGGEPAEIIQYLMETVVEEYTISLTDGTVTDPGEYQDAYGFSVVAKDRAETMEPRPESLIAEIDTLLALWPEGGPIPPENPAPLGQVIAQTSRVTLALP